MANGTWLALLVRTSRSRPTSTCTLEVGTPSTVAIAQSILSHRGCLLLLLSQFSLSCKDTGGASRRLRVHRHYHASTFWSVSTSVCLPTTWSFRLVQTEIIASSWHRWLPLLCRRDSTLIPTIRLGASIVSKEISLHLDIYYTSNVLFVVFHVSSRSINLSNRSIRIRIHLLRSWKLLVWFRIQRVWLTRLLEDSLQVVLKVLHFEFVYRITVLILEVSGLT